MATQNQTAFNNLLAAGTAYSITKLVLGVSATGIVAPTGNDTVKATGANLKESANPPMVVTANVRAVDWLDYGTDDYRAYEFGLYVTPAGGSEFLAVYGADPAGLGIVKAATHDTFQARIRLEWSSADLANATYTSVGNPPASTEVFGVVKLATQAEIDNPAVDGSDDDKVLTVGTTPRQKAVAALPSNPVQDQVAWYRGLLYPSWGALANVGPTRSAQMPRDVVIDNVGDIYIGMIGGAHKLDVSANTWTANAVGLPTGATSAASWAWDHESNQLCCLVSAPSAQRGFYTYNGSAWSKLFDFPAGVTDIGHIPFIKLQSGAWLMMFTNGTYYIRTAGAWEAGRTANSISGIAQNALVGMGEALNGDIMVLSTNNFRAFRLSLGEQTLRQVIAPLGISSGYGLSFDSSGNLYTFDGAGQVKKGTVSNATLPSGMGPCYWNGSGWVSF